MTSPADGVCLDGGKDAMVMKHVDDASFPVKIQGAGLDSFEMQVKFLFFFSESDL